MTDILPDPIESTWPMEIAREAVNAAARALYDIVKPRGGLEWPDLSAGQQADYRRRILDAALATAISNPCPTDEQIAAWIAGGLPAGERAAVIRHAAGCDRCRQLVADVITGGDDGPR